MTQHAYRIYYQSRELAKERRDPLLGTLWAATAGEAVHLAECDPEIARRAMPCASLRAVCVKEEESRGQDAFPMAMTSSPATCGSELGNWGGFSKASSRSMQSSPASRRARTAEQLAALRATRERKRAERQEKQWAEDNPLLAWAEEVRRQERHEEEGRGL